MAETFFNDAPIHTPNDDKFGVVPFAQMLAQSITNIQSPIGVAIALNGPWGSGKSSAVNLILHHLPISEENSDLVVINFKCWWYRGEEALTLAFLQELHANISKTIGDKAKEIIPKLGKNLLQAGPVIGPAVNLATGGVLGSFTKGAMDFASRYFSEKDSVEQLFNKLSEALMEQDKRFIVVIDDIDRLTPEEALLIFRLVKSVGRLPNIVYLLVFDRELAEKAVEQKYPSEGPHFLEKIIQASFDLPPPTRDDLNTAALSQIESICGSIDDQDELVRFMNVFYDVISPYLSTPRDLIRLTNTLTITWPSVSGEVNLADFVALEVIRLFETTVYAAIRNNKEDIVGVKNSYGRSENPSSKIDEYIKQVSEYRKETMKIALQRLFPRLEDVGYSSEFIQQWESQRQICTKKHFDTYFRMSIGEEQISKDEIDTLIANCGNKGYVKTYLQDACISVRKNGKSKVPLVLDELNTYASKIDKGDFETLLAAIFEIADDIYREEDSERGSFSVGDTHLRIHWLLRKLTFERCTLEERSNILLSACENAQLAWLVDFSNSAIRNYYPGEGKTPQPPENCLVEEGSLDSLKEMALKSIVDAASNGELLTNHDLAYLLFRWKDLSREEGEDVVAWCNSQLQDDKSVALIAKAFTKEGWSQGIGMFGLGDRVPIKNIRAETNGIDGLMDISQFRNRLEEISEYRQLDDNYMGYVNEFLEAWRKSENGDDD